MVSVWLVTVAMGIANACVIHQDEALHGHPASASHAVDLAPVPLLVGLSLPRVDRVAQPGPVRCSRLTIWHSPAGSLPGARTARSMARTCKPTPKASKPMAPSSATKETMMQMMDQMPEPATK